MLDHRLTTFRRTQYPQNHEIRPRRTRGGFRSPFGRIHSVTVRQDSSAWVETEPGDCCSAATVFFDAAFFAVVFLATVFFAAVFLATVFLVAAFFAVAFLAVLRAVFLAGAASSSADSAAVG